MPVIWNCAEREVIASDKKRLIVDSFTRYRIVEPLRFKQRAKVMSNFENQLRTFMDSSLRAAAANFDFQDIVRDKRDELIEEIRKDINQKTKNFGVEVVDFRVRRADLPKENSEAVLSPDADRTSSRKPTVFAPMVSVLPCRSALLLTVMPPLSSPMRGGIQR